MSDSAPHANISDVWSLPDASQPVSSVNSNDDKSYVPSPTTKSGSLGKSEASSSEGANWELEANSPEAEPVVEIYKAPEIPPTPEVGEKEKVQETPKPLVNTSEAQPVGKITEIPPVDKVLDRRTGKEVTHRVDINKADSVTKSADLKEQEFIEGVESIHSLI